MSLSLLPCGCEYDEAEDVVYWNGLGPGGCTEHKPTVEPPPPTWRLAILAHNGTPIRRDP